MIIWETLAESLQEEAAIMGYRNTPRNLKRIHDSGLAAMEIGKDGKIIAFAALWPTGHPSWLEIGSVWVDRNFRGRKLSSGIFRQLIREMIPAGKQAFLITHSVSRIIHLVERHGFIKVPADGWNESVPFSVTCEPCDREDRRNCPLKGSECLLFRLPG